MKYRELLEKIQRLPEERLDDKVTVMDPSTDDVFEIIGSEQCWYSDHNILETNQLILIRDY